MRFGRRGGGGDGVERVDEALSVRMDDIPFDPIRRSS